MLKQVFLFFPRITAVALAGIFLCLSAPPAGAATAAGYNLNINLVIPISPLLANALNQCDSHNWVAEPWNNGSTALEWNQFHGRQCLRAVFTSTGGPEAYLHTNNFFPPENWNTVTQVKVDVWVENGKNNLGLRLELYDNSGNNQQQVSAANVAGGSWNTVTLAVNAAAFQPAKFFLVLTNLVNGDSACLSNFRITRGGVDEPWDSFESPSYLWQGSQDFAPWNSSGNRNEPITHKVTYGNSAGALCIPWIHSGQNVAKMEATNLYGQNFSGFTKFQAWVYNDRTDAPVYMAFWDGANFLSATPQTVSIANTWTLMTWNRPSGTFNWAAPVTFMFMVDTSAGGSGQVYVDAIALVP